MRRCFAQHGLSVARMTAPVFLVAATLFVCSAHADPPAFVEGIEDLPLMPHLKQSDESPTVFDTPYGSIIESEAWGPSPDQDILDFYLKTLPQLGWSKQNETSFQRDAEHLTLNITRRDTMTHVLFRISRSP